MQVTYVASSEKLYLGQSQASALTLHLDHVYTLRFPSDRIGRTACWHSGLSALAGPHRAGTEGKCREHEPLEVVRLLCLWLPAW